MTLKLIYENDRLIRYSVLDFWPNWSEVISRNVIFLNIFEETTHVPSGRGCYNTYQVWSESANALRRYNLMSILA